MNGIITLFKTLLTWLYTYTGDYGLAIVCLTVLVKLCLLPLYARQRRVAGRSGELSSAAFESSGADRSVPDRAGRDGRYCRKQALPLDCVSSDKGPIWNPACLVCSRADSAAALSIYVFF